MATTTPQQFGRPPGSISGVQQGGMGLFHYNPPEQHLVRGQMGILQNQNSQYMQQAKQGAVEMANARGQANSDYAAGAAQRAAIEAALPIAAQDSETLTRVGLSNAEAEQRMRELEMQKSIASSSSSAPWTGDRLTAEGEAMRAHDLQLQRERLAFEGEQGGLGRGHDYGMGLMGIEADLFGNQMGYQYDLGRMDRGYQQDLGRMGQEYGYNRGLAQLGADLGLRGDYYNNRFGMQRDQAASRSSLYNNMINNGMQVPEFMANPEAFLGFTQAVLGFNFDEIFGGGW